MNINMSSSLMMSGLDARKVSTISQVERSMKRRCHLNASQLSRHLLLCLTMALSSPHGAQADDERAPHPKALDIWLSMGHARCETPIALSAQERVTFHFPDPVKVAVPSRAKGIKVHINEHLIVVTLDQTAHALSTPLSLSVVLESEETFHCAFVDPTSAQPSNSALESAYIDLIRVRHSTQKRDQQRQALVLIKTLIDELERSGTSLSSASSMPPPLSTSHLSSIASPDLLRALKELTLTLKTRGRLELMTRPQFKLGRSAPLRVQRALLYGTISQWWTTARALYLQVQMKNHSQPIFRVADVILTSPHRPAMRLKRDQIYPHRLSVPPDGGPHLLALIIPLSEARGATLTIKEDAQSEGQREIQVDLNSLLEGD
jgi:hypothetical protein